MYVNRKKRMLLGLQRIGIVIDFKHLIFDFFSHAFR